MTALETLLDTLRQSSMTEREKGTYFEDLILAYLRNEATYRDLYSKVQTWAEWAPTHGFSAKDDGIDLVAEEAGTGAIHAIQCKFYDPEHRLLKSEIDSFFTASGLSRQQATGLSVRSAVRFASFRPMKCVVGVRAWIAFQMLPQRE